MLADYRQHSPTGKPHVVKLYDKDISVTLEYSSPPRNHHRVTNGSECRFSYDKDTIEINGCP
jgi:hypothetical protein